METLVLCYEGAIVEKIQEICNPVGNGMNPPDNPWSILTDPLRNKGTAFTDEEREALQLHGRLPYHVSTLEEQVRRRYLNFSAQSSDLQKHLFLAALRNRNEVLFYKLVSEHLQEMLPLIYTPTIGEYSAAFSLLYVEPRGMYLTYPHRDKMEQIVASWERREQIDIIVVTDGERVLGLGDLGVGGMAIPMGKLTLYTLFGGIHPRSTLPVFLDVGTDNPKLLNDPSYLGWRHPRIRGEEYDAFVDRFIQCVQQLMPRALVQWEDFGRFHARPLLDRYRKKLPSFNDDIQGTAAVVLSALLSAAQGTNSCLEEQTIVVLGGGSAGIGICECLLGFLQTKGISRDRVLRSLYVVDVEGLVHTGLANLPDPQRPFAKDHRGIATWEVADQQHISLLEVIRNVHPSVLIGVSAQGGAFTQEIISTMAQFQQRPIIFPLSNPTSRCEAHPADILEWSGGRAIIATGSPFDSIRYDGVPVPIPQCNNVYIFPGVGLGVVACRSGQVTDSMLYGAAEVLSHYAVQGGTQNGSLFPPFEELRSVSREIALRVMQVAEDEGYASVTTRDAKQIALDRLMWMPDYDLGDRFYSAPH